MRLYNRYLATLALLFTGTTMVLAIGRQREFSLFASILLIEYLVVTLLFTRLHPRAQRLLSLTGYMFFGGWLVIMAKNILEVLAS